MENLPDSLRRRNAEPINRTQALRSVLLLLTIIAFWLPLGLFLLLSLASSASYEGRSAIAYFGFALAGICGIFSVVHITFAIISKPWKIPGFGAGAFIFNTIALAIVTLVTAYTLLTL